MIIRSFNKLIRIFKFAYDMANTDFKMSDIVVYVKLDSYLAQWLLHKHEGNTPIVFPKTGGTTEPKSRRP